MNASIVGKNRQQLKQKSLKNKKRLKHLLAHMQEKQPLIMYRYSITANLQNNKRAQPVDTMQFSMGDFYIEHYLKKQKTPPLNQFSLQYNKDHL
jgi:hypothetical protein